MPKYLTNTTYFSDNLGSLIQNGIVTTKKLVLNGDIDLSGSIVNGVNSLTFNQPNELTVVEKNFKITGMGYILYQGTTYNIGELLAAFSGTGQISPYPSITYDSSLNLTSFTGGMSFPSQSISSASINNSDFVTRSTNESLSGIKTWSGTQIFSSIQLNDNLIVDSGGTTVLNSNLKNVNFLSGLTSNLNTRLNTDETNITALQTKTTNMTFGSNITTFIGTMVFPTASISFNAIVGVACTLGQNQTVTGVKTFSAVQNFTSNLRLDGSLLLSTGTITIPQSTLLKLVNISDTTSAVGANLTSLQNQINSINTNLGNYVTETELTTTLTPINTDISTLNTKTQYISSTSLNTTILNTTNVSDLLITSTINGFSKGDLNNVLTQCSSLNSNCQNLITQAQNKADSAYNLASAAQGTASSAFALATTANGLAVTAGAVAGSALTSANTANSGLSTLSTQVDGIEVDVTELQVKCTQISYNSATGRTSVVDTLYSPYLQIGLLESGLNQTSTDQVTLSGVLRCNNRVEINNTLELVNNNNIILEGVINQDNANPPNNAENQFLAPTNILGTLTVSGNQSNSGIFTTSGLQTSLNSTNIQIGTTTASTLTINSNTTCNGDITMLTNKNLRLKNIVPILLDDIMFGDAAGTYNDYDIIFNMQIVANQPLTLNANFQQGTNLARKTYLGYNDTYTTYASTSATLSSPAIYLTSTNTSITSTATLSVSSVTNNIISSGTTSITGLTTNIDGTFVNIGNVLSTNILYGSTYVQALYSPSGTINAIGTVMQQFV